MKKIISLLIILLVLCGCRSINIDDIKNELDGIFSSVEEIDYYRINNNLPYYSYYLPSDTGEDELDSDSVVLKYDESKIIMNLNISDIVNTKYYTNYKFNDDGFFKADYLIYENSGTYLNNKEVKRNYSYKLYNYDGQYVLHLRTDDMNYYGTVAIQDIRNVTKHLLTIAKNTNVEYDKVLSDFANKDIIDYQRKQINLFDNSLPTNGELASMLIESATIGDIENTEENDGKNTVQEPEEKSEDSENKEEE